jgi:hypothetical protein
VEFMNVSLGGNVCLCERTGTSSPPNRCTQCGNSLIWWGLLLALDGPLLEMWRRAENIILIEPLYSLGSRLTLVEGVEGRFGKGGKERGSIFAAILLIQIKGDNTE